MLILRELWARFVYKRVTGVDVLILKELEGQRERWVEDEVRASRLRVARESPSVNS